MSVDLQSLQNSKWRASAILNLANLAKTLGTRLPDRFHVLSRFTSPGIVFQETGFDWRQK